MTILLVQGGTGLILAGTDVYMPPFGGFIAEKIAAKGLEPSEVRPYAPDTVDPTAYAEMRAMRAPVAEVHEIMYFALLGLIALHIIAVVQTELKQGGNIISAMFTGRKTISRPPSDQR